jgi:hypothetical protein
MIQIYFTIIKFYLYSLGGGRLKILTDPGIKEFDFWDQYPANPD